MNEPDAAPAPDDGVSAHVAADRPALPDRLSVDPASAHHDAAACEHAIGIRFNDVDRSDVEEYCVSESWIRVAVGRKTDRRGRPLTIKLKGRVEAFYR